MIKKEQTRSRTAFEERRANLVDGLSEADAES